MGVLLLDGFKRLSIKLPCYFNTELLEGNFIAEKYEILSPLGVTISIRKKAARNDAVRHQQSQGTSAPGFDQAHQVPVIHPASHCVAVHEL